MKLKRRIALLLSAAILAGNLAGCSGVLESLQSSMAAPNGAADVWVDSAIQGTIDRNTPTDPKQDFFLAENKEWILEHEPGLTEDEPVDVALFGSEELVRDRKRALLNPQSDIPRNGPDVGLSDEELEHARELVDVFAKAAGDFDRRDALGAEPLRPYLEDLEGIGSVEEFTEYMLDMEGRNFLGAPVVRLDVDVTFLDHLNNHLCALPVSTDDLFLHERHTYQNMGADDITAKEIASLTVHTVLETLGYDSAYATRLIQNSYLLEAELGKNSKMTVFDGEQYENEYGMDCTPDELAEMLQNYPIKALLAYYGFDTTDTIRVFEPKYMKTVGRLYSEQYLEYWKAYYAVHTILECGNLLDRQTQEKVTYIKNRGVEQAKGETLPSAIDDPDDVDMLLEEYVTPYLAAPLEMLYIASYCSSAEKAAAAKMADQIKNQMYILLDDAEWLTEETRAVTKDKLDNMPIHVLYPDNYVSYLSLNLTPDMSLMDMVRNIRLFNIRKQAAKIDQPADRTEWDLAMVPTTTVNAFNYPSLNCVFICAGIISDGFLFDVDMPTEVQYARLGTVVGHEITHGFDTTGCQYDKYGNENPIFGVKETIDFGSKTSTLMNWYAALTPVPGMGSYPANVSGEAIADMGGMKCALLAAKELPDFDYDLFFRAYAGMWAKVNTLEIEQVYAKGDEHPLAFLRVNVTLQQFDEFLNTYGVQPGDGMYLSPENRILVW